MSRSQVVVVDLTSPTYEVLVTYHLTLDADQEVDPWGRRSRRTTATF